MPIKTVKNLRQILIDLKLVAEAELDSCLNSSDLSVDDALALLTRQQLLTSFQEGRLRADNASMRACACMQQVLDVAARLLRAAFLADVSGQHVPYCAASRQCIMPRAQSPALGAAVLLNGV